MAASTTELKTQHLHNWHSFSQKLTLAAFITVLATEKREDSSLFPYCRYSPIVQSDAAVSDGGGCAVPSSLLDCLQPALLFFLSHQFFLPTLLCWLRRNLCLKLTSLVSVLGACLPHIFFFRNNVIYFHSLKCQVY